MREAHIEAEQVGVQLADGRQRGVAVGNGDDLEPETSQMLGDQLALRGVVFDHQGDAPDWKIQGSVGGRASAQHPKNVGQSRGSSLRRKPVFEWRGRC